MCEGQEKVPCQGCGGVSIEAGDASQLPESKRRAIEKERAFRMAMEEYYARR